MRISDQGNLQYLIDTTLELLKANKLTDLYDLLNKSSVSIDHTGYDTWNGGIDYFTVYVTVDVATFVSISGQIKATETALLEQFSIATRHLDTEAFAKVAIVPRAKAGLDWNRLTGLTTKSRLSEDLHFLKSTMISVSTGGERIEEVNGKYKERYTLIRKALDRLNIKNPNPYDDLWQWYNKWRTSFGKYTERRTYISKMYDPLLQLVEEADDSELIDITVDLTDWDRLERSLSEIRIRQNEAAAEEQYQVVGFLCRESIITLAQAVFKVEKHPIIDGIPASKTDAKRMLEA